MQAGGLFSPLKRKRTPPTDLGGSSPRAGRLARQLEELTLGKIPFALAEEEEGSGDLDMEITVRPPPEYQEGVEKGEGFGEEVGDGMAIGDGEYPGFGSALELWKAQDKGKRGARLVSPPLTVVRREGESSDDDTMTLLDEDPDDDGGGGLFGVGFKPTPTQSYVRSQKKQQQVLCFFPSIPVGR